MITSQDKELITRLIKNYAGNMSTDKLLAYIADNNGMLNVCRLLVKKNNEDDREAISWVDNQCYQKKVDVRSFLYEIQQVLSVFQPGQESDEHYFTLGLEVGASDEEIKEAYRKLSLKYHPDTANSNDSNNPTLFIEINKAYHALRNNEVGGRAHMAPSTPATHWRQENRKSFEGAAKKKTHLFWFAGLTIGMIVVSMLAARGYQKKAMITGLQLHQAAFIPPNTNNEKDIEEESLTDESATVEVETEMEVVTEKSLAEDLPEKEKEVTVESEPIVRSPAFVAESIDTTPEPENSKQHVVQENKDEKQDSEPVLSVPVEKTIVSPEVVGATKEIKKSENVVKATPVIKLSPLVPATPVEIKEQVSPPQEVPDETQTRIEHFLEDYIAAYKNKDLLSFSRFFDTQATENGKALGDVLPTYVELFNTTSEIHLDISILKWSENQSNIVLNGRFTIRIYYKDGGKVKGSGNISFLLRDSQTEFLIQEMTYHFDKQ